MFSSYYPIGEKIVSIEVGFIMSYDRWTLELTASKYYGAPKARPFVKESIKLYKDGEIISVTMAKYNKNSQEREKIGNTIVSLRGNSLTEAWLLQDIRRRLLLKQGNMSDPLQWELAAAGEGKLTSRRWFFVVFAKSPLDSCVLSQCNSKKHHAKW